MIGRLRIFADLGRLRISLSAAFSAMMGFLIASYYAGPGMFLLGAGVFFLACGASGLNQCQEQKTDAMMERTKGRPLPSGVISPRDALIFSGACAITGTGLTFLAGGVPAAVAGLFALLWYNGLYTPLKAITAFAAVPGALVGAIPPAIGWQAGGGRLSDPGLIVLCLFFFLWQVPHFWLLASNCGGQYSGAGLPSITSVFSGRQLSRILFIWIASAAVSSVLLVLNGVALHHTVKYLLAAASFWLIFAGARILSKDAGEIVKRRIFGKINLYLFVVMALLFADRLLL
ncbi:MAG: protoheme IX farnesyltransferase [Nitrospirae bacterium]|nr:protoheme IX farnesyltransferase [Nitrospirota bacterium]